MTMLSEVYAYLDGLYIRQDDKELDAIIEYAKKRLYSIRQGMR